MSSTYQKFEKDDSIIAIEYMPFFEYLQFGMPNATYWNADYVEWIDQNPEILAQYAKWFYYTLPGHRNSWYQQQSF